MNQNETMTYDRIKKYIDISAYNTNFIDNVIQNRVAELNCKTTDEFLKIIELDAVELAIFEKNLINSYSLFFRNRLTFEVLRHVYLPSLLNKTKDNTEIRIWSAGCAAGQEAYSLAILFETFNKNSSRQFNYRIFATDKSYDAIQVAVSGQYRKNDLGNLTLVEAEAWFTKIDKKFKIEKSLNEHIQFEFFDLLSKECACPSSSIFGDFDIIMCANVLIYYNVDVQKQILSNFRKCVSTKGILITGETERDLYIRNGFFELYPNSAIFVVK